MFVAEYRRSKNLLLLNSSHFKSLKRLTASFVNILTVNEVDYMCVCIKLVPPGFHGGFL